MRVQLDIGDGVDRTGRELVLFDDRQILRERAAADRVAHRLVELETVHDPRFIRREPLIVEQHIESVGAQKALRHFRRRSAHCDPAAIFGAITAARPGVLRAAAVA